MASQTVDCARFDEYVDRLTAVVGHADRRWPLTAYLTGLLLPGKRKSIEPMAAKIDPRHVSRAHQSIYPTCTFKRGIWVSKEEMEETDARVVADKGERWLR